MKGAWHLDDVKAAFVTATKQAANAAAQVSRAVATEVVHGIVGAQCLVNYQLENQVASCFPWVIYSARSKKEGSPNAHVSAWVLDKKTLLAGANARLSGRRLDALLELCRKEVQHLARLKHPSVLRLISPLEETRTQLVFLSEPIFASVDDVLHSGDGHLPAALEAERRALNVSELEIKHGLLQVTDALHFLHHDAGLAHRAVSPASLLITKAGAWKLAGFRFAAPLDAYATASTDVFDYANPDHSLLGRALQPLVAYSAPELVIPRLAPSRPLLPAGDVFSLALVAYELLTKRSLLPSSCSVGEYESRVLAMPSGDMSQVPSSFATTLRQMLAMTPDARLPTAAFSGCAYFAGDLHLRALKFLDNALQKDVQQRAAFLADLPSMLPNFDDRIVVYNASSFIMRAQNSMIRVHV